MTYQPLDTGSVPALVRARPRLAAEMAGEDAFDVDEVGDGNLNLVFIVRGRTDPTRALVLKQALPWLRVAGESWPLTRDRMRIETAALRQFEELVPEFTPRILDHDEELSFVAMEFLGEHRVMRGELMAGASLPLAARHLGSFMARLHFATSDLAMDGPAKKARVAAFLNPALCELQEDFVFTNPFLESPENRWNPALDADVRGLRRDAELKAAIAEVKASYMTVGQALLHGDLHTGSVMVTADDTRVIDPEFAFYGPMGYDVGTMLANLAIDHLAHEVHTPDATRRRAIRDRLSAHMAELWTTYETVFEQVWREAGDGDLASRAWWAFPGGDAAFEMFRRRYLARVLADSAGHGGCEMLRRLMGIVSVPELSTIADDRARADIERRVMRVARRWLLETRAGDTIADLVGVVTDEAAA